MSAPISVPPSMSRSAMAIEPSAKEGVPETVNPSVVTVPSKNASLNSNDDVPKSISLSVTADKAPSLIVI